MAKPVFKNEYEKNVWHYDNLCKCYEDKRKSFSKALEAALMDGFPIDFVPGYASYYTVLYQAIVTSHDKQAQNIKMLVEAGANVNLTTEANWTFLMLCASMSQCKPVIIKTILSKTENVNVCSKGPGYTAIGLFIDRIIHGGFQDEKDGQKLFTLLKELLDAGADPELNAFWKTEDYNFSWQNKLKEKIQSFLVSYLEHKEELQRGTSADYEYEL